MYRREYLEMCDGDQVALDWLQGDEGLPDDAPVMVVLHGFTGTSADVWPMAREAGRRGMRCVAVNKRGHEEESRLRNPKLLSFTDTSDVREVFTVLRERFPSNVALTCVGYSAGSGLLCTYMNQYKSDSYVDAAVLISPGYDSVQLFERRGGTMTWPYGRLLNEGQKQLLRRHRHVLEDRIDVDAALRSTTISEFTEHVYCPMYGYQDANEYWMKNNPMIGLEEPCVPVMCLNASDDPVTPECNVAFDLFESYSSILLVLTSGGGHCGFLEGHRANFWSCDLACDFLVNVLEFRSQS